MTPLAASISDATIWSVTFDDTRSVDYDRNSFIIQATGGLYYKKLTIVNEAEDYRIVMTLLGSSDTPSSVPCIIKHSSRSVMMILE